MKHLMKFEKFSDQGKVDSIDELRNIIEVNLNDIISIEGAYEIEVFGDDIIQVFINTDIANIDNAYEFTKRFENDPVLSFYFYDVDYLNDNNSPYEVVYVFKFIEPSYNPSHKNAFN